MKHTLIVLFFALFTMAFQCDETAYIEMPKGYFSSNVTISPSTQSIAIGDTLWIESNLQSPLYDTLTKIEVEFYGQNSNICFNIRKWNKQNNAKRHKDFEFVTQKGVVNQIITLTDTTIFYSSYTDGVVGELKLGLIFKLKGIYSIDFAPVRHTQLINNYWENYGSANYIYMDTPNEIKNGDILPQFTGNDNHIGLLQAFNYQSIIDNDNSYVFEVK